ncbi:MAG: deoxyguanosinetriphosphate triphosphohydrolase [Clostridia bacterium]|nr:deoxyguanosinetriphosphate triphosphohydrolase [Clostridia bacterium]
MNIRQMQEQAEQDNLSPMAQLSRNSRGRAVDEPQCDLRTDYARDRDRIIHCKSFRRLKHKTQVFISLDNDHYRTRLTHTLEVSQIARTMARALRLNEDLVEAISLGHDLGHTPFGHSGERALDKIAPGGFRHYEQSLRVVDKLEKDGKGLNLTWEVRDGIVCHTGDTLAGTNEGIIVKYADRFAYINHDIDDALRAGIIHVEDIPAEFRSVLGETHSRRINTLISDLVYNSDKRQKICMSDRVYTAMMGLRKFMFSNVYGRLGERDYQAEVIIEKMYQHFMQYPEKMPPEYTRLLDSEAREAVVCDYIAGMTDIYCVNFFKKLFLPI